MNVKTEVLERYREVVDDWEAFIASVQTPLPTCLVANALRIDRDALVARLDRRGVGTQPVAWTDDALILDERKSPGNRFEYMSGLYNVQEEAAVIPVKLLDPQPGDRVLDMCAAPGNKTAQIAMAMRNRGTVVANDRNAGRMRATRAILDRFGLANVAMTLCNGANYPNVVGGFDRVLVDVPCSCEGTSRKTPSVLDNVSESSYENLGGIQIALLRRAFELCEPGGRVVYSTCTYAPEENERVIDRVVKELDYEVDWVPARLEGFDHAPGLTSWQGEQFDERMSAAMRVWPHLNDTGGFFVAVFDKPVDAPPAPERPAAADVLQPIDPTPWVEPLAERFGWDSWDDWVLFAPNRKSICLASSDLEPAAGVDNAGIGLSALRKKMAIPKPTTSIAMLLGDQTTRHILDLEPDQMDAFLRRDDLTLPSEQLETCDSDGYVLVGCEGFAVGIGRLRYAEGTVESLYPKAWSLSAGASAFEDES